MEEFGGEEVEVAEEEVGFYFCVVGGCGEAGISTSGDVLE